MDLKSLEKKVIVSVQAAYGEPLYNLECIKAMLLSVVNGGASAVRVAGARDVKCAKECLKVPVIGLTKPKTLPENWLDVVYITPTLNDIQELLDANADVVALDATSREHQFERKDALNLIHDAGKLAMADISTFDEGIICAELGFDIVSTTLAGYTTYSKTDSNLPDFELLKKLVDSVSTPIILEGRIWEPVQVKKAFELGAHSVVIGSAITRPQLITKRFIEESL